MTPPKPITRLFVGDDLRAGAEIALPPDPSHFLRSVLRCGPGDAVGLFNGRDGEWLSRIEVVGKKGCSLRVEAQTRPQAVEPDLWLAFAPLKKSPMDFVVEKATELGVSCLQPVFTRHTAAARVNIRRLAATAAEAAEQCRRLSVPEVRDPVSLETLMTKWPPDRPLFVADETGAGIPIAEAMAGARGGTGAAAAHGILIGPEGGFARAELDALAKLPFATRIALGPRILRAETAALAALSCFQAMAGDWRA